MVAIVVVVMLFMISVAVNGTVNDVISMSLTPTFDLGVYRDIFTADQRIKNFDVKAEITESRELLVFYTVMNLIFRGVFPAFYVLTIMFYFITFIYKLHQQLRHFHRVVKQEHSHDTLENTNDLDVMQVRIIEEITWASRPIMRSALQVAMFFVVALLYVDSLVISRFIFRAGSTNFQSYFFPLIMAMTFMHVIVLAMSLGIFILPQVPLYYSVSYLKKLQVHPLRIKYLSLARKALKEPTRELLAMKQFYWQQVREVEKLPALPFNYRQVLLLVSSFAFSLVTVLVSILQSLIVP